MGTYPGSTLDMAEMPYFGIVANNNIIVDVTAFMYKRFAHWISILWFINILQCTQVAQTDRKAVCPVGHIKSKCLFEFSLVQHGIAWTDYGTGIFATMARHNDTVFVSRLPGNLFGEIIPAAYAFIAEMI